MKLRCRFEAHLLAEAELEQVFQAATKIWREVPLRIQGVEMLADYLSEYGCRVDGERVFFPEPVVEKVLARIREARAAWVAAGGSSEPEWPAPEILMYTHGQALIACDRETNRLRPATTADLEEWCRMVDALGDVSRQHPSFIPTDVPAGARDFHTFATILLNSRRAHRVSVYCEEMLPYFIEASVIARGSLEEVKREPVFAAKLWVNTPFMITAENVRIAMKARELLGQPLVASTMPVAGAATPITIAGQLAQTTAESLALNALTLAVDDRLSGVSTAALVMDMKDLSHRQSGPDVMLHRLAASEMNAYLFGGKARLYGYNQGAQAVGPQSLYEKAMGTALGIAAGDRSIGIGCLAYSDVSSTVQLLLDYEMGLSFRHLFREVQVDDEHIGLDSIVEIAQRGAYYLDSEHTSQFFREEAWFPCFLDHRNPYGWQRDPSDMIERARDRARQLAATATNQCPLSEGQQSEVRRLLASAYRAAGE